MVNGYIFVYAFIHGLHSSCTTLQLKSQWRKIKSICRCHGSSNLKRWLAANQREQINTQQTLRPDGAIIYYWVQRQSQITHTDILTPGELGAQNRIVSNFQL